MEFIKVTIVLVMAIAFCQASIVDFDDYFDKEVDIGNRIYKGSLVAEGEAPYMASMIIGNSDIKVHICGGSIITSHHILTAAHCIEMAPIQITKIEQISKNIFIRVGTIRWNEGPSLYRIDHNITHPDYDSSTSNNDVGLLVTKIPIRFSSKVKPVILQNHHINEGRYTRLTGFSETEPGSDPQFVLNLKKIEGNTMKDDACKYALDNALEGEKIIYGDDFEWDSKLFPKTMICVKYEELVGFCKGDSGSPLLLLDGDDEEYGTQIGVTSWKVQCGENYPYVFAKISTFFDWILSVLLPAKAVKKP